MKIPKFKFDLEIVILSIIILVFFGLVVAILSGNEGNHQFVDLADSFLSGQLHLNNFLSEKNTVDYIFFGGKVYWPLAPFSAVLLMPFVFLFGPDFPAAYLQMILIFLIFGLLYKIVQHFNFTIKESLWLALAFSFCSVFLGVALVPWAYFFAQVVATLFLLLAIDESLTKKRWLLVGTYVALAFFTRYTVILTALFFILYILFKDFDQKQWRAKFKLLLLFLLPIIIVGNLVLTYNYLRFGDFFETGYKYANIEPGDKFSRAEYGLFNLKNIPSNFYYYFIKTPEPVFDSDSLHLAPPYLKPSHISMGFFITAPIFLLIFFKRPKKGKENLMVNLLWGVSLVQLLFILSYFSPGSIMFLGPRYMLDILPWLFILLLLALKERGLTWPVKSLILCSALFNFYLFMGYF